MTNIIDSFLKTYSVGLTTLYKQYFTADDAQSFNNIIENVRPELIAGCQLLLNKGESLAEINSYLLYIVNEFCKKNSKLELKLQSEYICPGCLFLGTTTILDYRKVLYCHVCDELIKTDLRIGQSLVYNTFRIHNKTGYRCCDCQRFIPKPLSDTTSISCPYIDCMFSGTIDNLKKMHHPMIRSKVDLSCFHAKTIDCINSSQFNIIKNIITDQMDMVYYNSSAFTINHKKAAYQAILNLLYKYQTDMINYLVDQNRSGGFQHRIFQEYIKIIEASLPWTYIKNKRAYTITSLVDEELGIFNGISTFNAIVNDKLCIKNNTKEYYIGGRSASLTKPYFIGKILDITDTYGHTHMHDIDEYSFNTIKMRNVKPNTQVVVTHLRIPPHYQMGGMTHVNRIRKNIVDKIKLL